MLGTFRLTKKRKDIELLATFTDVSDRKAMERRLCLVGVSGVFLHDAKKAVRNDKDKSTNLKSLIYKVQ
jgi:hypothetical protein